MRASEGLQGAVHSAYEGGKRLICLFLGREEVVDNDKASSRVLLLKLRCKRLPHDLGIVHRVLNEWLNRRSHIIVNEASSLQICDLPLVLVCSSCRLPWLWIGALNNEPASSLGHEQGLHGELPLLVVALVQGGDVAV